jgi:hypothetical protein
MVSTFFCHGRLPLQHSGPRNLVGADEQIISLHDLALFVPIRFALRAESQLNVFN